LRADPDATLARHCATWAEAEGQVVGVSTMGRTITRLGWAYKKTVGASERAEAARAAWRAAVATWEPDDVLVLDERGANVGRAPTHARAPMPARHATRAPTTPPWRC